MPQIRGLPVLMLLTMLFALSSALQIPYCKESITEPITDGQLLEKALTQLSLTQKYKETDKIKDHLEKYILLVQKIQKALDSTGNLATPNADSDEVMTEMKALLEKERWLWKIKDFNCGYMMIVHINMRRGVPHA